MVEYCHGPLGYGTFRTFPCVPAAIVARLSNEGPARVTEIAKPFDMSLNAVSKHLKVLEQAGLIQRTKVGRDHVITFDPSPLRDIARWVHTYEKFWAERLDRLEDHFKNKKKRETK